MSREFTSSRQAFNYAYAERLRELGHCDADILLMYEDINWDEHHSGGGCGPRALAEAHSKALRAAKEPAG